ncbi:hypothetical protein [Pontibacter anaerobius]|uniref:Secreted protein n=1 Tax=Pontibacter anaerobius TaxID=2993940 RepID=A0ABT3RG94_9BACT|nr:hypothetical protein [Pontibacter anaerobius]MCX2740637.1 hypothetical protein [Pontibacter anaerobius]
MNKNVTAVFAAVCGLFMASCGTSSDLRPDEKVSVDTVEPGTRETFNVSDAGSKEATAGAVQGDIEHEQVMPDRDLGGNTLQPGDSVSEAVETNTKAGATKE